MANELNLNPMRIDSNGLVTFPAERLIRSIIHYRGGTLNDNAVYVYPNDVAGDRITISTDSKNGGGRDFDYLPITTTVRKSEGDQTGTTRSHDEPLRITSMRVFGLVAGDALIITFA
jgi:hypothetical protein